MHHNDASKWDDIQRVEGWAGEVRLNMVRLIAIAVLYGRHLLEVAFGPADSPARGIYHIRATFICAMWAGCAIVLHFWLARRRFAPWLKFATTCFDAAMLTLLCISAGDPRSPLVLLYFPLIMAAPLRLSLRLVYTATAATILGYLCVLGVYAWYLIGFHRYYSSPELRIPRSQEAIVVLAMLTVGFLAGQCVRQSRRIASGLSLTATPAQEQ